MVRRRDVLAALGLASLSAGTRVWAGSQSDPKISGPTNYPAARWLPRIKPSSSVEDLIPFARSLARNRSGIQGYGLGVLAPGDSVLIVVDAGANDTVMAAVSRALTERGIKAHIAKDYELVGVTGGDARRLREATRGTPADGFMAVRVFWIEHFGLAWPDPEVPKKWLEARRPDLYSKLYPKSHELPADLKSVHQKLQMMPVGAAIRGYLQEHPEVKGVYWGKGSFRRHGLHPMESKYMGLFTADNLWELMSEIPSYPADVWLLTEEKTIEPLAYVDRVHITDPQGTDITFNVSEEQAKRWLEGVYERGHLKMYPDMATGQFPASLLNYPHRSKTWLSRQPIIAINGVLAGTNGHGGFFPRVEVHIKDGYITEAAGGGIFGDLLREFLNYPQINELSYPFYAQGHPGFWRLFECALGTNPKYFRNPHELYNFGDGTDTEVQRSGALHFGLGVDILSAPPSVIQQWRKFGSEHKLPVGHGFHIHNYSPTYKVHLRNIDMWLTLVDRGHLTALDDPHVRALASRYGDPDRILAEAWIPDIPGISSPGRYEDYAANPWAYVGPCIHKVLATNAERSS
ncbi:MAG: hypothetical protein ACRD10_10790 [Terriglobia bacterium]